MRKTDRAKPAFLALSCVGFASSAYAAEPQGDAATPPRETELKGVTVTATAIDDSYGTEPANTPKFVAPLIDTPRSVVVVPAKLIKDSGSATLADALRTVPGITFGAAEGGNPIGDRPFIRGFDAQGSTFLDGARDVGSQTREVFDIDQVQIIRGSDSAMGGRGSAGGMINIISKLPKADNFIDGDATYGSANYKRLTFDVNRKLSDTIAFRIAGMWHDQDYVDRDAIWSRRWGIAPSITFGLGTPTRLTASYYHLHTRELPEVGIPFEQACNSAAICNIPLGHTTTMPVHHLTTADGRTGTVSRDTYYGLKDRDFRRADTDDATIKLEHDFGAFTLTNGLRYGRNTQAYIYTQPDDTQGNVYNTGQVWRRANTRYGTQTGLFEQLDLSGKFNTGKIEHSIAAGVEFDWEKSRRGTYVLATGSTISPRCTIADGRSLPIAPTPSIRTRTDPLDQLHKRSASNVPTPIPKIGRIGETVNKATTQSAYAFDSITIFPSLILNLGGRVDRFHSTQVAPTTVAPIVLVKTGRTDTVFTYQAGLVFKPSEDTSLYVSRATAATPPNALLGEGREDNAIGTDPTQVDDLKVQRTASWEIGAKALVLGDKLSLTFDVFRTLINNARVTGSDGLFDFIGKTRSQGFEFGLNSNITEKWNIFGGYTYVDAKIIDGGLTVTSGLSAPSVNTGKRLPLSAKNTATISTSYQVTPKLSIGGGAYYTSRVNSGYGDNRTKVGNVIVITKTITRTTPAYVRLDANAAYKINDNIELRLNVQNLTNKRYYSQVFTNHYATMAPGRTILGTVGLHF